MTQLGGGLGWAFMERTKWTLLVISNCEVPPQPATIRFDCWSGSGIPGPLARVAEAGKLCRLCRSQGAAKDYRPSNVCDIELLIASRAGYADENER